MRKGKAATPGRMVMTVFVALAFALYPLAAIGQPPQAPEKPGVGKLKPAPKKPMPKVPPKTFKKPVPPPKVKPKPAPPMKFKPKPAPPKPVGPKPRAPMKFKPKPAPTKPLAEQPKQ